MAAMAISKWPPKFQMAAKTFFTGNLMKHRENSEKSEKTPKTWAPRPKMAAKIQNIR
jgi:hypothetical protein